MHKKSKAITNIWNDESSNESQVEDDNNVSQIVLIGSLIYNDNLTVRKTAKSIMTKFIENFVMTNTKHCSPETDSDSVAKFEIDEKVRQDAYKNMYA